jgi:aspartokinase/homoserine dehydrogenase 1
MKVLKFGGTSVGSAKNITKVISILEKSSKNDQLVVVVSAVGGITDKLLVAANQAVFKDNDYKNTLEEIKISHLDIVRNLISSANQSIIQEKISTLFIGLEQLLEGLYLTNELSPKISDKLLSYGENLSSLIIAETLKERGLDCKLKNAQELIVTNSAFTNAEVNHKKTNSAIESYFKSNDHKITLLPGFVSKSEDGEITTLGRGGSDYTAAILAGALNAEELQIWTDVSGMFTTNPDLVDQALPIKKISYQAAVELSHFGAKVLYPPSVQPVLDENIPILIKNTFDPEHVGTLITNTIENDSKSLITGISNINNIALLTLQGNGMVGIPGFSRRLFETLANEKINIILITQASSEHSICFGINQNDAQRAQSAVDKVFENEITLHKIDPIIVEDNLSIIAVVGDNMKSHQGISGKMFSALGKNNVNIRAIAQGASERNISAVIDSKDVKKALNVLHERFFEDDTKQIHLFIAGVGNVGEKLIDQIQQQHDFLLRKHRIDLRIVGLANSRKMVFKKGGINLDEWVHEFDFAESSSIQGFYNKTVELNLRNSIFVDITANEKISEQYANYLKKSIAVVACSKIACSGSFENYKNLHNLSLKYNAAFLYETNVGAGLPIIDTLNNMITSGDKVTSIQAVLSGSLNFIFNNFNDRKNFHDTVKQAQFEGYTEPDPRIDLSGIDVARKILILARENGGEMEIDDIQIDSFLTTSNMESDSVDDFYDTLISDESHFQGIYASAKSNNSRLKYVAEFNDGKAKIGLREIPEGHPFYDLEGKDNIVMFYTERYPEQPLIVKGAGAGADVTASGLFADIIRIANN